jgi:Fe-S cluster assembly ATP-binding protein
VLSGREGYEVTGGTAASRTARTSWRWSRRNARPPGLFLAFQYPVELPGVGNATFLRTALNACARRAAIPELDAMQFLKLARERMKALSMSDDMLKRGVNVGFSGGEKKRNEILQMALLQPEALAILDETDSGLDIDALKIVADGVNAMRGPGFSALVITHYQRLLDYIVPDRVHVLIGGRIVKSGGPELAKELEAQGYAPSRPRHDDCRADRRRGLPRALRGAEGPPARRPQALAQRAASRCRRALRGTRLPHAPRRAVEVHRPRAPSRRPPSPSP